MKAKRRKRRCSAALVQPWLWPISWVVQRQGTKKPVVNNTQLVDHYAELYYLMNCRVMIIHDLPEIHVKQLACHTCAMQCDAICNGCNVQCNLTLQTKPWNPRRTTTMESHLLGAPSGRLWWYSPSYDSSGKQGTLLIDKWHSNTEAIQLRQLQLVIYGNRSEYSGLC